MSGLQSTMWIAEEIIRKMIPSLQSATIIAGSFFLAILILVLVLNSKRKGSKSSARAEKQKVSGKKWNRIIPIAIISGIIGTCLIVPKYYNKSGMSKSSASYSWKKKPHQYGYNSNERFGGPYDTVITKCDGSNFCFTVYGGKSDTHFYGKNKNGRIEGWWEQLNPRAGGTWNLKKDICDPALYTGICTDPYLPDGADIELRLKY